MSGIKTKLPRAISDLACEFDATEFTADDSNPQEAEKLEDEQDPHSRSIVFKYGLATPHEGTDIVYEQLKAAHRYRNTLVEIERGRRAAIRSAERKYGGADMELLTNHLEEATEQVEEAVARAKAYRSRMRCRALLPALTEELRAARAKEKAARQAWREGRHKLSEAPLVAAWRDVIDERALGLVRGARDLSDCFWGTYLLVEAAMRKSAGELPLYGGRAEEKDPRFVRFDGAGRVGVQLQGGLSVDEAIGGETPQGGGPRVHRRLQLTQPPDGWWAARRCDRRRMAQHGEIALRVGSEGRAPVWARWRLDMHRPLPEGAVITWAVVHRTRCGPHAAWHLTLTVRVPNVAPQKSAIGGAVGINLGWRMLPELDKMRVAAWADEKNETGELRLDSVLRTLRLPDQIRAERDVALNGARAMLLAARSTDLWLAAQLQHAHAWRSPKHFVQLAARARDAEMGVGSAWRRDLETFVANDRHAWAQQEHLRQRGLRRRREIYRMFAATMADAYDTIVVEPPGGRKEIARKVEPGTVRDQKEQELSAQQVEIARSNRVLACTSELAGCLKNAAMMRGKRYIEMPPADITRTCPACGEIADRGQAEHVRLVCVCGHKWDQDYEGASRELLVRWRERSGAAETAEPARKTKKSKNGAPAGESLYDRRRRLRAAKVLRLETSRKLVDESAG